jgi:hypothetical protein
MQDVSPDLSRWSHVASYLSGIIDLDASARKHGALVRRRGVRSAEDMLRLALLYGPGGLSLRSVASFATEAGIADLCDVSLLDRLRNSGDWLTEVLNQLLAHKREQALPQGRGLGRVRFGIVDGSIVSFPGSEGSDWRLHARYEPALGGFTDLRITEATTAEALDCVAVFPGDVLAQDRGYARAGNFAHAQEQGADFITRIGWRALKLSGDDGEPFDLIAALPETGPETVEHLVQICQDAGKPTIPARLILARTPDEAAEQQRQRVVRNAISKGRKIDPRTIKAAGFMMLVTSLSAQDASAEEVLSLYRMRWQIELAFKRIKSLGGFGELRADDPRLVRTWLLAHLISVVLIEASLGDDLDSPP